MEHKLICSSGPCKSLTRLDKGFEPMKTDCVVDATTHRAGVTLPVISANFFKGFNYYHQNDRVFKLNDQVHQLPLEAKISFLAS